MFITVTDINGNDMLVAIHKIDSVVQIPKKDVTESEEDTSPAYSVLTVGGVSFKIRTTPSEVDKKLYDTMKSLKK